MNKIVLSSILIITFLFLTGTALAQTYTYTMTKNGNTYVTTKTIVGDKKIIETKVYDASGNLIDTKIVEKTLSPTPVKEIVYPSKNPLPTVYPKPTPTILPSKNPLPTPTPVKVESDLPLEINEQTGNITVENNEIATEPQLVVNKAKSSGLDIVSNIEVVEREGLPKYRVNGNKNKKLLAIIKVKLPTSYVYNAEGQLEAVEQKVIIKIADALSI